MDIERNGVRRVGVRSLFLLAFSVVAVVPLGTASAEKAEKRIESARMERKVAVKSAGREFSLRVDESKLLRLGSPASTILVGNPIVAGVLVKDPRTLIVSGESYGVTSLTIMNQENEVIASYALRVHGAVSDSSHLTMYKGRARETFSCGSGGCQPIVKVGDHGDYLEWASESIRKRGELIDEMGKAAR